MKKAKEPYAILVSFKPKIRADGEIERITISQDNQQISLTKEQAISLVQQIKARLP